MLDLRLVGHERERRDAVGSVYFRYAITLTLSAVVVLLGDHLPFPATQLLAVLVSLLLLNVVLHTVIRLAPRRRWPTIVNAYADSLFAAPMFASTGGFLSPFVISHYVSALGSAFSSARGIHNGRRVGAIGSLLVLSYVGVAILHWTGVIANRVEYSAQLMADGVFVMVVTGVVGAVMAGGFVLITSLQANAATRLREVIRAYQHVSESGDRTLDGGFYSDLSRRLSLALKCEGAFVATIDGGSHMMVVGRFGIVAEHVGREAIAGSVLEDAVRFPLVCLAPATQGDAGSSLCGAIARSYSVLKCLRSSDGEAIGIIGALFDRMPDDPSLAPAVVRVFAERCVAEMERREAQRRRLESERMLLHAQKMETIGHLAGGFAHDFNNALNSIMGYAQILQERTPADSPHAKYAPLMLGVCRKAASLTTQLLSFARRSVLEFQTVDINRSVEDVAGILRASYGNAITVSVRFDADRAMVSADPARFSHTLLSLCANARDAMPLGGEIALSVSCVDVANGVRLCRPELFNPAPGRYVCVAVRDTGRGMSEDTLSRLFEPFYTTKPEGKAAGLGLAAAFGCVKSHAGFIDVQSAPAKGSTFSVYLPQLVSEPVADSVQQDEAKVNVVLIDDDRATVDSFTEALADHGLDVKGFTRGAEALDYYRSHREAVDLFVVDLLMPRMDGREILARLRDVDPTIKVIMLTGMATESESADLCRAGVVAVLGKPIAPSELAKRILVACPPPAHA